MAARGNAESGAGYCKSRGVGVGGWRLKRMNQQWEKVRLYNKTNKQNNVACFQSKWESWREWKGRSIEEVDLNRKDINS